MKIKGSILSPPKEEEEEEGSFLSHHMRFLNLIYKTVSYGSHPTTTSPKEDDVFTASTVEYV